MVIDVKSIVQDVPFTEKEIPKKSNNARSSSIFKVKFKKDDFLTKKSQGKLYNYFVFINLKKTVLRIILLELELLILYNVKRFFLIAIISLL